MSKENKKIEEFDLRNLQKNHKAISEIKDRIANCEFEKAILINKLQQEVNTNDALREHMNARYGLVSIDLVSGKITEIEDGKPDQEN